MTTSRLYIGLIILVGVVGGYLYYSSFSSTTATIPPSPIPANDTLESFKDIQLNFSVLNSAQYKNLVIFGQVPVTPVAGGKRDVFAPF